MMGKFPMASPHAALALKTRTASTGANVLNPVTLSGSVAGDVVAVLAGALKTDQNDNLIPAVPAGWTRPASGQIEFIEAFGSDEMLAAQILFKKVAGGEGNITLWANAPTNISTEIWRFRPSLRSPVANGALSRDGSNPAAATVVTTGVVAPAAALAIFVRRVNAIGDSFAPAADQTFDLNNGSLKMRSKYRLAEAAPPAIALDMGDGGPAGVAVYAGLYLEM